LQPTLIRVGIQHWLNAGAKKMELEVENGFGTKKCSWNKKMLLEQKNGFGTKTWGWSKKMELEQKNRVGITDGIQHNWTSKKQNIMM